MRGERSGNRAGSPSPGQSQATASSRPLLPSQVLGASEEPAQFTLTNAASTHITSLGISSPTPGELAFSSFQNLLSGPYFWSLPSRFQGDKVGRGWEEKGNSRQQGHPRRRLGSRGVVVPLEKRWKRWLGQWEGPIVGAPAERLPPCIPGDLLWRRATLHSDPEAPAWLPAPAQAAIGGPARQWHCLGASPFSGAQPWPTHHLHCALLGGEQHCLCSL